MTESITTYFENMIREEEFTDFSDVLTNMDFIMANYQEAENLSIAQLKSKFEEAKLTVEAENEVTTSACINLHIGNETLSMEKGESADELYDNLRAAIMDRLAAGEPCGDWENKSISAINTELREMADDAFAEPEVATTSATPDETGIRHTISVSTTPQGTAGTVTAESELFISGVKKNATGAM